MIRPLSFPPLVVLLSSCGGNAGRSTEIRSSFSITPSAEYNGSREGFGGGYGFGGDHILRNFSGETTTLILDRPARTTISIPGVPTSGTLTFGPGAIPAEHFEGNGTTRKVWTAAGGTARIVVSGAYVGLSEVQIDFSPTLTSIGNGALGTFTVRGYGQTEL